MAARDETTRRLSAAIASNTYRANPDRPAQRRRREDVVPDHLVASYLREVDPTDSLTAMTRARRVVAAWRRDEAKRLLDAHRATLGDDGGAAA